MTFVWTVLDEIRSFVLSRTLRIKLLQNVYRSKVDRTLLLFAFSMMINGFFLIVEPNLLFTVTPLLLGVPHLISSFRYSSENLGGTFNLKSKPIALFFMIWFSTFILQDWVHPAWIAIASFVLCAAAFRRAYFLALVAAFGLYYAPMWALVFLLMAHNFFAFVPWYQSAKNRDEKNGVVSTLFGLVLSILVLSVGLESQLNRELIQPIFAQLFPSTLPGSQTMWVVAFLLSQSTHYFIWLKAIPDFKMPSKTPGGFRYSFSEYRKHAPSWTLWLFVLLFIPILFLAIDDLNLSAARDFYFKIAAFHGFYEWVSFGARSK